MERLLTEGVENGRYISYSCFRPSPCSCQAAGAYWIENAVDMSGSAYELLDLLAGASRQKSEAIEEPITQQDERSNS